jgi:hypothetical protein
MHDPIAPPGLQSKHPVDRTFLALAGPADRVGLMHAVTNALAISLYAASWVARRRGRRGSGVGLALAGAAVSGVGGYLGSHLALGRKLGSRHVAYGEGSPDA